MDMCKGNVRGTYMYAYQPSRWCAEARHLIATFSKGEEMRAECQHSGPLILSVNWQQSSPNRVLMV